MYVSCDVITLDVLNVKVYACTCVCVCVWGGASCDGVDVREPYNVCIVCVCACVSYGLIRLYVFNGNVCVCRVCVCVHVVWRN